MVVLRCIIAAAQLLHLALAITARGVPFGQLHLCAEIDFFKNCSELRIVHRGPFAFGEARKLGQLPVRDAAKQNVTPQIVHPVEQGFRPPPGLSTPRDSLVDLLSDQKAHRSAGGGSAAGVTH